jgi:hypothetical protein
VTSSHRGIHGLPVPASRTRLACGFPRCTGRILDGLDFPSNRTKGKGMTSKKVILGSDYPFSDSKIELLKIEKAGISDTEKENTLYKNAQRLINSQETVFGL